MPTEAELKDLFSNFSIFGVGYLDNIYFEDLEHLENLNFPCPNARNADHLNLDHYSKSIQNCLANINQQIEQSILAHFFGDIKSNGYFFWDGSDQASQNWHNDFKTKTHHNCNFLLYLNDLNREDGGQLEVRGPLETKTIFPRKYRLVWLNQLHQFQHRVHNTPKTRRVIEFKYNLKGWGL
jgi:hypothetical protein